MRGRADSNPHPSIFRQPVVHRLHRELRNTFYGVRWWHVAYKVLALTYLGFMLWVASFLFPAASSWLIPRHSAAHFLDLQAFEQ